MNETEVAPIKRGPGRPPKMMPQPVELSSAPIEESNPEAFKSAHAPLPIAVDPTDPATNPNLRIKTSPMPASSQPLSGKPQWNEPHLDVNPVIEDSLLAIPQRFANYIDKVFKRKNDPENLKRYRVNGCSANLTNVNPEIMKDVPWFFEVSVFVYENDSKNKAGKPKTRSLAVVNMDRVLVKPASFRCEAETFLLHYEQE